MAHGVVHPDEIDTGFGDIGGNEEAIRKLLQVTEILIKPPPELLISTVLNRRLFSSPPGILLYGPPGCGKTMLARALAKESGVRFLSASLATVMDKWVGETEKYLEALFSLARKIAPVIVFIDEIEALTRRRGLASWSGGGGGGDREWNASMKSQLLSQWDGLGKGKEERVIILGATNRPQDIDEAFLRRMPLQIKVDLPGVHERERILETILGEDMIRELELDINELAIHTSGFSGSDLQELCRRVVLDASFTRQIISTDHFLAKALAMQSEHDDCLSYNC